MAFGGKSWPIDSRDMSFGRVSTGSDLCLGGFFEFTPFSNNTGNPNWVVGIAFLKNVYSIFRYQPPAIGFAALSDARAVASTGECRCQAGFVYWETCPFRCSARRKREWKQHRGWYRRQQRQQRQR